MDRPWQLPHGCNRATDVCHRDIDIEFVAISARCGVYRRVVATGWPRDSAARRRTRVAVPRVVRARSTKLAVDQR